jgi:hypothetical protein
MENMKIIFNGKELDALLEFELIFLVEYDNIQ